MMIFAGVEQRCHHIKRMRIKMEDMIEHFLLKYRNIKISLLQLEQLVTNVDYKNFAEAILALEEKNILQRVNASGENGKSPSLAYSYKINKTLLRKNLNNIIVQAKKHFHPSIYIEYYLTKTMEEWEKDWPRLQQLNDYLLQNDFPQNRTLSSERSFEIFHDEKYISDGGGKVLLEQVRVWDLLQIWPVADPVSFAINPNVLSNRKHLHLIVENKATYYGLLPALKESSFTSILYGEGKAIINTIDVFPMQLPLQNAKHTYLYFGDLDYTGIEIWHSLYKKIVVHPAEPFYTACFNYPQAYGKINQRKNSDALKSFLQYFSDNHQQKITNMFEQGCYYPQEVLKSEELQRIWREMDWSIQRS